MGRLEGRVAIVTGGAQGIGAAYCKRFAEEGAHVVVSDVVDGSAVVGAIEQAGGKAIFVAADVSKEPDTKALVAKTIETFGKLDILMANAGLYTHLDRKKATEITVEEWDRVHDVNVKGVWLSAKAAIPEMQKQGYGKIINIASTVSYKGAPSITHYGASKAAVLGITMSMATEFGDDGIRINAIAPGPTETETGRAIETDADRARRTKSANNRAIKRVGQPEDLVGLAVFLASAESDYMTGQTIVVDGGGLMR